MSKILSTLMCYLCQDTKRCGEYELGYPSQEPPIICIIWGGVEDEPNHTTARKPGPL